MPKWMARPFDDDEPENAPPDSPASDEPEYTFEGYNIDFSTKVMLTPPSPAATGNGAVAQAQSRRR